MNINLMENKHLNMEWREMDQLIDSVDIYIEFTIIKL